MASHCSVLKNCEPIAYASKDALLEASKGVYTTARTIDKSFVLEFNAHVTRLVDSCSTLMKAGSIVPEPSAASTLQSYDLLRPHVFSSVQSALETFNKQFPDDHDERRITLLLDFAPPASHVRGFDITTYTEPLPRPPTEPVDIKIGHCPPSRHGKVAKDAQWTRDRKILEDQMGAANEVVMIDSNSFLLEGTQSNVFVVIDNKIYSPDREDILEGTIRKVIKRVCEQNAIPLVLSAEVSLLNISAWQGAFLTSTSRLVLPIKSCDLLLDVADINGARSFNLPLDSPLVEKIAALVKEDLKRESVDTCVY